MQVERRFIGVPAASTGKHDVVSPEVLTPAQRSAAAMGLLMDTLVITPGTYASFDAMFQLLPTCVRVEVTSFISRGRPGYFESVSLFFADAPDVAQSPCVYAYGSPERVAVEAALARFDAEFSLM